MPDAQPLAFVIMPFDSALDAVYLELIKSTLEAAGFRVQRADDLVTSRNILDDIVAKLAEADIVVADLTDLNPNVFYELGIAHSINGRVLMITQDVSSLPFDLQSYRVLEYDTHFSRFNEAKSRLAEFASAAFRSELPYGSPVSDFDRTNRARAIPSETLRTVGQGGGGGGGDDDDDDEPGLLDHMLDMIEAGAVLTKSVEEIGAATERVGAQMADATALLESANAIEDPVRHMRASHTAVRQVGLHLNEYSRFLDEQNTEYEVALATFGTSFESALAAQQPGTDEERQVLRDQMSTILGWEGSIAGSRASMQEFVDTIGTTPRVEKYSTKAMNQAQHQLERLIGNLEQTEATLTRIRRVISRLIGDDS